MKVLVTGGLGVIGSRICHRLLENGHQVVIIDACEEPRNEWIAKPLEKQTTILRGRIEDHDKHLIEIVSEADAVIHAAASTGIPYSMTDPHGVWRSNVDATRVLLEALRVHPKPTAILSSVKPYRVWPLPDSGLDESAVLEPDEPYAASKAAQSLLAVTYSKSYGLPVVTFRCSNLYGPAPSHGPRHGWMHWFAISAAIGRPIEVQGTGQQSRDMLHADDVYGACMLAIKNAGTLAGKIFNIGGGAHNRITVLEAAKFLQERTGVPIKYAPPRSLDDLHVFVNYGAYLRATEWRPLVEVKTGLGQVLKWAQANAGELAELYKNV